ncbi:DUF1134 domain-containing protein [Maricaulaceae bacterium NA33B04]|nr:DUF1134 domain-containing protein [Maricaulaceae bacterium NA33B04]
MLRSVLIATLPALLAVTGCATQSSPEPDYGQPSRYQDNIDTYSREELVDVTADFFGVTAEAAASVLERSFSDLGRPVGYIAGEEVSGAAGVGVRYGEGYLTMKGASESQKVYWTGPTIGFDAGGDASRTFTLVYNLTNIDDLYQRFPGVEGSAYLVGGLAVTYQRADGVTLAPIRSGVGLRAGANVGYVSYSRRRSWIPF